MASTPLHCLRLLRISCHHNYHLSKSRDLSILSYLNNKSTFSEEEHSKIDIPRVRKVFEKEFPNYYQDGKFVSRTSHVQFIDQALAKLEELGLERDKEAYKELLRVFPPGLFHPSSTLPYGLFHAPQQEAAVRILLKMEQNFVRPDKDFERIIIDAFTIRSDVWNKIARTNYWTMKMRNVDMYPIPEQLPDEPHETAKISILRMTIDEKSIVSVTNTSKVPDCVDKTWIVFSQSPAQQNIIAKLEGKSTLYIEEGGLTYVGKKYMNYHLLRYYVDEKEAMRRAQKPKADFDFNTLKMKFYGKPIREKLIESEENHYSDGSYTLAIGITGTSSQDSLLSWLKILQKRNPNLSNMNVVFRMSRSSPEIVEYKGQSNT